ncbi:DUF6415 family natural product biosynthesis protein [Streptomyces sp. 2A115]|uniref:DUF6415 family natural product biosynthesis protein n=1 Tax=Streptomyces sp. 2A115 TaxID=3457439 RepID=UPI003FD3B9A4
MTTSTTRSTGAAEAVVPPVDIETMRETAGRLLDPDASPDALPPAAAELDTLTRLMRGQLESLIPEIERAAGPRPKNVAQYCALACVGEARGKLRTEARPAPAGMAGYARRLARVLNALCDHHERLVGVTP